MSENFIKDDSKYNGRLFLNETDNYPQYDLYSKEENEKNCYKNSISTLQELNPLSQQYFSQNNVDFIQNLIINRVRIISNNEYNIGKQSDLQLQIIMRSIYLSYSKNLMNNINKQINVLNNKVVEECIKVIIPNIKQYIGYRKDISTPRHIMTLPASVSSKGDKSLKHAYL